MSYSGAHQIVDMVETTRARVRDRLRGSLAGWNLAAQTVWGPLLTLAALILMDQLARRGMPVLYPFPVLLLTVVISAYLGGLRTALVSAVLTVLYGVHFFAEPGLPLRYQPTEAYSLLVVGLVAPGMAVLVSRLRDAAQRGRVAELSRAEAEALDRRVSFLSHVSATLAGSLDYEVTLRDLARSLVPALGDWCAIHVVDERGTARFLAGAHRDPARDLLIRALGEHEEGRIPFGFPALNEPRPVEVTESLLRTLADSEDHLKLYRALQPAWVPNCRCRPAAALPASSPWG
jgi:K+-sensing histidine kinase KdpD